MDENTHLIDFIKNTFFLAFHNLSPDSLAKNLLQLETASNPEATSAGPFIQSEQFDFVFDPATFSSVTSTLRQYSGQTAMQTLVKC